MHGHLKHNLQFQILFFKFRLFSVFGIHKIQLNLFVIDSHNHVSTRTAYYVTRLFHK